MSDEPPPPESNIDVPLTHQEIRERAFEIWERNHRPDGFEIEFWLTAQRELMAERKAASKAAKTSPDPASQRK